MVHIPFFAMAFEAPLKTEEIPIRDPFIYADQENEIYYLYAQSGNRRDSGFLGVEAYASKDLLHWSQPQPVLKLPEKAGVKWVWAPEMHAHLGQYYLFVTLTLHEELPVDKPVQSNRWPPMFIRGTHVYHAASPTGPFRPFRESSHTPPDWMALDGTLYVEDEVPYMVFCHEWVQTVDGTMDFVRLKGDLSAPVRRPQLLFKASDAPGVAFSPDRGNVTDGCFLYRSPKSERLFMIWSTFIPGKGYSVLLTHSESGEIRGPWVDQRTIYTDNGGHGMIFETFEGDLLLSLHQPNSGGRERLHLFEVTDDGETLSVGKEYSP